MRFYCRANWLPCLQAELTKSMFCLFLLLIIWNLQTKNQIPTEHLRNMYVQEVFPKQSVFRLQETILQVNICKPFLKIFMKTTFPNDIPFMLKNRTEKLLIF